MSDSGARLLDVLARAGERLAWAEELLLRPTTHSVAELIQILEECCEMLAGLDSQLRSHPTENRALNPEADSAALTGAARQWRSTLHRLANLTAGASSFCNGWASMAGYLPAYTSAGEASQPAAGGSQLDRLG